MRLEFQKPVASSQFTLPVVSVIVVIAWLLLPSASTPVDAGAYGLWRYVAEYLQSGSVGTYIALGIAALAVYIMAELNQSHVLLRISSRMISSVFAFVMGVLVCAHNVQPAMPIMLIVLLSYSPFFHMYQSLNPTLPFVVFMLISMASLLFPKLLVVLVIYWLSMMYMRAFSVRCFLASVIGAVLPYWIGSAVAYVMGEYDLLTNFWHEFSTFQMPDYTVLTFHQWMVLAFLFVLYLSGTIDFYINNFKDKARTRILYNVLVVHGLFMLLALLAMPQHFMVWALLFAIDASILFAHFVALTYNRFTHIYLLVLLVLSIAVAAVQVLNINIMLPWSH